MVRLPIDKIMPNPAQPRKVFREEELVGLAESIRENGLLQPITVRKENGRYLLIAGERRLRASRLAGLKEISAIVTECEERDSAVLALLENVQRKDLQMFEQATALAALLREQNLTQEEAARRLGMSQSALANKIRLLRLTQAEQLTIIEHNLTERHARALLKVENIALRQKLLQIIIERNLNVGQSEALIESATQKQSKRKPKRTFVAKDVRLFLNTIDHAVDAMKNAGIEAQTEKKETAEYIECIVRIPKLLRTGT